MFEEAIVDQNPHWRGETYEAGIPRRALATVREYCDIRQVVSVVGVRRCGKSTLLRQTINHLIDEKGVPRNNILFLNLENPCFTPFRNDVRNLEQLYADYLKLADPRGRVYVFLDEPQYFRDWQVFVKARYESDDINIKFFISGSNSQLLSSDLLTLLSGRTLPVQLYPFDFREYLLARGVSVSSRVELLGVRNRVRKLCDDYLAWGGFPEAVLNGNPRIRKEILANCAKNILYQDIVPRFELKKPFDVERLFFYLVSNLGCLFTYNRLAAAAGISDKTVKDYIGFFSAAFLLYPIERFDFSVKKRMRGPRKIYCVDNGLGTAASFSFSADLGRFLENMVFVDFLRRGRKVYFYRTANGLEVDFYSPDREGAPVFLQVCADMTSEATRAREVRALVKAADEQGLDSGVIVTVDEESVIEAQGMTIRVVPAWKYLAGL